MNAVILEDEIVAAKRLKRLINDLDSKIEIIGEFESVEDIAEYLMRNPAPDILFLDIQVVDGNSFELFDTVEISSAVIFTTAYDEFAVQAFRKNAIDYLLKPIKPKELQEAVSKAKRLSNEKMLSLGENFSTPKSRFLIPFGNKLYTIRTSDIAYIYSENKLSYFVMKDGKKIPSDFKLQNLQTSLDPQFFFRANRQFIIHIDAIRDMITYSKSRIKLHLSPSHDSEIIVSTETTPKFKDWLGR